jgi:hypothetical protein
MMPFVGARLAVMTWILLLFGISEFGSAQAAGGASSPYAPCWRTSRRRSVSKLPKGLPA